MGSRLNFTRSDQAVCPRLNSLACAWPPGSTNKLCSPEECMERIADSINRAHAETAGVTIVLENVAGMVRISALPRCILPSLPCIHTWRKAIAAYARAPCPRASADGNHVWGA